MQPTGWTAAYSDTINLNSPYNLVSGTVLGTGTTTPLAPYPGDVANGDMQSFDGNGGDVYLAQTFTPATSGPVEVSVAFGGRDAGSGTGTGSSWQILDGLGALVLASGPTVNPATGSWTNTSSFPAISLLAGTTYTFRISLANADMVDAASIQTVPEPSTWATLALGVGICTMAWISRHRSVS